MSKHNFLAVGLWASAFAFAGATAPVHAMQMVYSPTLPQFGGLNGQALSVLQFEKQLEDQRDAEQEAAAREAQRELDAASSATSRLTDTIINYLNIEIARRISDEILGGNSSFGEFFVGDGVTVSYDRLDGKLSVTVSDINGSSTRVELPDISEAP